METNNGTNNKSRLTAAYNAYLNRFPPSGETANPKQTWGIPVVIGGFAVLLQGGPRTDTEDLDLAVENGSIICEIEDVVEAEVKRNPDRLFSIKKEKGAPEKWCIRIGDKTPPVQFDCVPVGRGFVNDPLEAVEIEGIKCASIPDLVSMKAKALADPKRDRAQKANDAKDFGYLLRKMVDGNERMPARLDKENLRSNLQNAPHRAVAASRSKGADDPEPEDADGPKRSDAERQLEELVAKIFPA